MRSWKLGSICAAILLAVSISTVAIAQGGGGGGRGFGGQGRGGFGGGFGGAPTLSNLPLPYMKAALSLTDDQNTKIQAVQEKVRTDMQALRQPDASGQRPDRATMMAKMKDINDQAAKDIEAVLTEAQTKKVALVLKEAGSYSAVGIRLEVVPDLKLTADQKAKLATIAADATKAQEATQKDIADARAAQDQQKMQEIFQTMQTARTATHEKALAVLTDDQKAIITKYDQDHPRPQRGGQRPGAGGGNGNA
jgi:hypothetical protein